MLIHCHPRSGATVADIDDDYADFDVEFDDDPYDEPVGSCEQCGTNLYSEDDPEYCDQCLWRLQGGL